jgi:hypothetical protein
LVFYPQGLYAAEDAWNLRRDSDGVQVYTRHVEGSPILEYKASVTVDAPLEEIIPLYEDEKKLPVWFYQCTAAELLEDEGPLQKIIYFVMDFPFPVAQRDLIFRRVKSTDAQSGAVSYSMDALPDKLPLKKGKVRMPYLKTLWRFTPLKDGRTEIYFQQHSDPGGSIPTFVVNKLVVDIPFHSLKNLRQLIMTEKD